MNTDSFTEISNAIWAAMCEIEKESDSKTFRISDEAPYLHIYNKNIRFGYIAMNNNSIELVYRYHPNLYCCRFIMTKDEWYITSANLRNVKMPLSFDEFKYVLNIVLPDCVPGSEHVFDIYNEVQSRLFNAAYDATLSKVISKGIPCTLNLGQSIKFIIDRISYEFVGHHTMVRVDASGPHVFNVQDMQQFLANLPVLH